jgi:hypothetical protein
LEHVKLLFLFTDTTTETLPPLSNENEINITTTSPTYNGYARAMLSILLSTQELQRRVDAYTLERIIQQASGSSSSSSGGTKISTNTMIRRLVTVTVNPGFVDSDYLLFKQRYSFLLNLFFS